MASDQSPRLFAVIPAAGQSRRMGQPKLLLPLAEGTVISRLLAVLRRPEIVETLVVIRPGDEPLRSAVVQAGATPLVPKEPPPEMRTSVEHALHYLLERCSPSPEDGWLLSPADHPLLDAAVLDQLVACWRNSPDKIVIPTHRGRRGHPVIFPFRLADEVFALPADEGLNALVRRHTEQVTELAVNSPAILLDLDTPEDYERLRTSDSSR